MAEEMEIRPDVLAGAVSRLLESFRYRSLDSNRSLPHGWLSLSGGAATALLGGSVAFLILWAGTETVTAFLVASLTAIPLFMFGYSLFQLYFLWKEMSHRKYVISPKGVKIVDDYLDKSTVEIGFSNVTDIKEEQPLSQRIFGTGTLKLNTAGSDYSEAKIEYVKNIDVLKEQLSSMVSENQRSSQRSDALEKPERASTAETLRELKPNIKAAIASDILIGIIVTPLVFLGTAGVLIFRGAGQEISVLAGGAFSAAIFLYITIGDYFNKNATEYRFKQDRVEIHEGFLNVSTENIPYDRITDVSMNKPLTQRIFGTGTILLNTAGNDTFEGAVGFIDNPEEEFKNIKRIIGQK